MSNGRRTKILKKIKEKGLRKAFEDGQIVFIVLASTRENFYQELKRYMK